MSSKTNYLNHCLELAECSPLHHRHGCVIVKGGKIIGRGFNRPSLAGGALKTGKLPVSASLPSSAIAKSKRAQKGETEEYSNHPKQSPDDTDTSTFTPFEMSQRFCSTPLTVHSEMAACMDVPKSTTLSSKTLSCEKPSCKLPGSKRKDGGLWRHATAAYVGRFFAKISAGQAHVTSRCWL